MTGRSLFKLAPRCFVTLAPAVVSVAGFSQTASAVVYNADTTINSVTALGESFQVVNDATLTVTTGGQLDAFPGSSAIGESGGSGTLIVEGTGVVNTNDANLNVGDYIGSGVLTVRGDAIVNVGDALILSAREASTVNLSGNGQINVGSGPTPASGLFRVGWPVDLGTRNRNALINQAGGRFDAAAASVEFNTDFLDSFAWNFSAGTILLQGDWTAGGDDLLGQPWFNAQTEITVDFDGTVTTFTGLEGNSSILTLTVNKTSGATSIRMPTNAEFDRSIQFYEIKSAGNLLTTQTWNSFANQNIDAIDGPDPGTIVGDSPEENWTEGSGSGTGILTEAFLINSTNFDPLDAPISIGSIYTGGDLGAEDLVFTYGLTDETLVFGRVSYITGGLAGDFNVDGNVDGLDFLEWQSGFGTLYVADDLANWEEEYGTTASSAAASAVPEPSTLALVVLLCLLTRCRALRICSRSFLIGRPNTKLS